MDNFTDDVGSICNETVVNIELDDDQVDLDLTNYDEDEIRHINEVMNKDKSLRLEERERKRKVENFLDQTIASIEMKNVDSGEKFCLVCGEKFALLINPRKLCMMCEKGVCNNCLFKFYHNDIVMCKLCYVICEREGKTGKWFNSISKNNGRFRRSATIIIMASIRRIKAKFSASTAIERQPSQKPEPIRPLGNGNLHQPMYLTKKNSPKPPRKFNFEKEAMKIANKVSDSVEVAYDVTDSREVEVVGNAIINNDTLTLDDNTIEHISDVKSNLGSMASLSASMMSVYSETHESYSTGIPVSGEVLFSVFYSEQMSILTITVEQCRNIAIADRKKQRTDPYVKTYLLPDRTKVSKKKTSVKIRTINPVFKETLSYQIPPSGIASRTLSLSVWHKSSLVQYNIFLGEVQLVLADLDLKNQQANWFLFHEKRKYPMRSAGFIFKGEIMIRLKYKASARKDIKGALHVYVVGAKNLETDRHTVNSYVKGYLLPNKDAKSKQKTQVYKKSLNPTWNEMLLFQDVSPEDLKDRSLELSIYHQNRLKVNEFLGGVRLNLGLGLHSSEHVQWMDAQGSEKQAWEMFLANPNEFTDVTLNLRPNLDF